MDDALDHLALLSRLQDAFLADVRDADPGAPVPACGDWRVRDLVEHVGSVHHWAAAQARRRPETPLEDGPFDLAPLYAEHAAELRTTLAALDPDAPAWTLLAPDDPASTVRFWHRRQTHETLVHLHDLRAAGGSTVDDVDPTAAAGASRPHSRSASSRAGADAVAAGAPSPRTHDRPASVARSTTGRASGSARPRRTWRGAMTVTTSSTVSAQTGVVVDGDADALAAALAGRITP